MAELKVTPRITVSDETAERCLRLLEMWQADNPDCKIEGEWMEHNRVEFRIVPIKAEAALAGSGAEVPLDGGGDAT